MNKKLLTVGASVLAGALGGKVLSSKLAKKAAVSTVAGGLRVKESLDETIEKIRVSTEDIVAEAKDKNEKEDLEEAIKEEAVDIEKVAKEKAEEESCPEEEEN